MSRTNNRTERSNGARLGMFIGDALAMPVHWYYDTWALQRDYGVVRDYQQPHNPHPDSILWRSSYRPAGRRAEILHDQAQFWGQKDIHYHQFLQAGDNTLNLQLAARLFLLLAENSYSPERWLAELIEFMTTPGNHRDTYIEEYLRHFFMNYGRGLPPERCGRQEEKHIGGLALFLPLLLTGEEATPGQQEAALDHLALTHGGSFMRQGAALIGRILVAALAGEPLQSAIVRESRKAPPPFRDHDYAGLVDFPDRVVVGSHFASACYLDQALPATLYLAWKYGEQPEEALVANTMCGGDNCGRGAVLGALLGAHHGLQAWPDRWLDGLRQPPVKLEATGDRDTTPHHTDT